MKISDICRGGGKLKETPIKAWDSKLYVPRRKVIGGIGAILAVGQAPAIVRSMVGGRCGIWFGRKGVPTAKDYVQDGLVAMWDGIENAGWGVHDQNATVWKDLVRNHDLPIDSSSIGVEPQCMLRLYTSHNRTSLKTSISTPSALTIDACFRTPATMGDNSQVLVCFGRVSSQRTPCLVKKGVNFGSFEWSADWSTKVNLVTDTTYSLASTFDGRTPTIGYRNAVIAEATDSDTWGFTNDVIGVLGDERGGNYAAFGWRAHSVRIYSRALTAEEIAANYAVDKQRFNLP